METLSTLKVHPNLENNNRTVKFIAKFLEVCKNVNVYTPYADIRFQDLSRAAICNPNDQNLQNLFNFDTFKKNVEN